MSRDDSTTEYRGTAAGNPNWKPVSKLEPKFRFYALYDRIYPRDVLMAAWDRVRRNRGAPGIDGVTIDQIVCSEGGPAQLVEDLHHELRTKSYKPRPVWRVYIPKPDGRQRPLVSQPCVIAWLRWQHF